MDTILVKMDGCNGRIVNMIGGGANQIGKIVWFGTQITETGSLGFVFFNIRRGCIF